MADADYLRESLVEPARRLVEGYPPMMPSYRQLSEGDLDGLVAWLQSRGAVERASDAGGRTVAIDPVCGMPIHVGSDTPSLSLGGQTHYFCSETCRDRFRAGWHPPQHQEARGHRLPADSNPMTVQEIRQPTRRSRWSGGPGLRNREIGDPGRRTSGP